MNERESITSPFGNAPRAFGAIRKDESFANCTQLSPVLMPSQKALRDISTKDENPKTFRAASLCSATAFVSPLRGHTHERFAAFSDASTKAESLKTLRRFVALSYERPKGERLKSKSTSLCSLTKEDSLRFYEFVGLSPTSASRCLAT